MSTDLKPKQRIGQVKASLRKKVILWTLLGAVIAAGLYSAYRYTGATTVEVAVARVRRGEFVISVNTRGEIRSSKSVILSAPQIPDMQIVTLASSGQAVKKGDIVVEFNPAQQE